MIVVMIELHKLKGYRERTLYTATHIADRFIMESTKAGHPPICLLLLALCCTLMAAKIDQPIAPSFNRMIKLVND
jgi:hypothetical protein